MNRPIRTLAVFCLLLFGALMVNATVIQYVDAGELNANPSNRRVVDATFSRERGDILVGREPIARSVPSDDEFEYQREYLAPFRYAHVSGYFSYFSQTGIERTQNSVLSGDDSRLFVTRLVDMVSNSEPVGGSVELTLDDGAQTAAYEGLEALGPSTQGSVVAIEPSTGKVLAMVSSPSFDTNRFADHDFGRLNDTFEELDAREDEPLLNRAIQTTLPPGSTFKIVTAAAALEQGIATAADDPVPGGPSYQLPLTDISVENGGRDCGSGDIPFTQAMEQSCNTTFLALADQIGVEDMQEQAEKFGFNSEYLEDLPLQAESRYPGTLDEPQTALSGIGQSDVAATPLQMAMVAAGIANDGVVMKPYLVDEVRSPDLDVLDRTDPSELSEATSPETAEVITQMMVNTVSVGTATPAAIPGIDVAGKTGTAESAPGRPPYAWFVSFAPAEDPQVAVAVLVEAPGGQQEIAGGTLGGPISRAVTEAVIDQ
ncbi:penicillin-binding protein 2 [Nocardioides sp. CFH 31398]|uniref:peptidoglycan D,D-transpeptidase FtsI family protein n=1 Tax=Nocardioides sp. CFH 31398 TaxID=2919579 RepID=UPI001F063D57|nr:penicillin-binding protein 2 [Nocardioides sp. CFH 31398]MCH1865670.1 penicillin-binding protein 2 [Nocardioides sp. CFH 31398]